MRVLTYNIRGGLGMDGRRDLTRLARVVMAQAPDVVCLQEVHQRLSQSGLVDQPRRLGALLGMPVVFQAAARYGVGGFGNLVATRLPILSVSRRRLTSVREARGVLEVCVQAPSGPVTVFTTHWGLKDQERESQAAETAAWVSGADGPAVICGDFNERPDAPAVTLLLARSGLQDAGADENHPTFPAEDPQARIDYVLYTADLRLAQHSTVPAQASDHLPVVADFS